MNVHDCLTSLTTAEEEIKKLQSKVTDHIYCEDPCPTDEDETRLNVVSRYLSLAIDHLHTAGLQLAEIQRTDNVEPDYADHV